MEYKAGLQVSISFLFFDVKGSIIWALPCILLFCFHYIWTLQCRWVFEWKTKQTL